VTCKKQKEYIGTNPYPEKVMAEQCPNPVLTSTCISRSGYESIRDAVRSQLRSISSRCSNKECPRADWAGCVLRMAGHDFMDFDPSTDPPSGGSDGCLDLTDQDNMGLAECLHHGEHGQALKSTYLKYCGHISLADFLVIAAEAVMYHSLSATQQAKQNVNFIKHFKWGRTTARECPGSADRLPHGTDGCGAVKNVFIDSMGLSKSEATALMGVHTLGRARTENSGHFGRWTTSAKNSRKFNNDYYKSLLKKGWRPMKKVCGRESTHQWVRQGPGPMPSGSNTEMMLDTDLCLAYNIPKGASGEVCCAWQDQSLGNKWERWEHCGGKWQGARKGLAKIRGPAKRTKKGDCSRKGYAASHVKRFAKSESEWLKAFQRAWTKATSNGFSDLKPLRVSCSVEATAAEGEPREDGEAAADEEEGKAASKEEEAEEEEGEAAEEEGYEAEAGVDEAAAEEAKEEAGEAAAKEKEAKEEKGEAAEEAGEAAAEEAQEEAGEASLQEEEAEIEKGEAAEEAEEEEGEAAAKEEAAEEKGEVAAKEEGEAATKEEAEEGANAGEEEAEEVVLMQKKPQPVNESCSWEP